MCCNRLYSAAPSPGLAQGWVLSESFCPSGVSSQLTKPNLFLWSQHHDNSFAQSSGRTPVWMMSPRRLSHHHVRVAMQARACADPQLLGPRADTQGTAVESRNFKLACQPSDPGRAPSLPLHLGFHLKNRSKVQLSDSPFPLVPGSALRGSSDIWSTNEDSFLHREQGGLPLLCVDHSTSAAIAEMQMHQKCPINLHRPGHHPPELHGRAHFREKLSSKLT